MKGVAIYFTFIPTLSTLMSPIEYNVVLFLIIKFKNVKNIYILTIGLLLTLTACQDRDRFEEDFLGSWTLTDFNMKGSIDLDIPNSEPIEFRGVIKSSDAMMNILDNGDGMSGEVDMQGKLVIVQITTINGVLVDESELELDFASFGMGTESNWISDGLTFEIDDLGVELDGDSLIMSFIDALPMDSDFGAEYESFDMIWTRS